MEYDREADFTKVRAYAWRILAEGQGPIPGTNAEILDGRIKTAVDRELGKKGLALRATQAEADVFLAYYVTVDFKSSGQSVDPGGPTSNTKFEQVWVTDELRGVLVVEMFDARSGHRIWHASGSVKANPQKQEKNVNNLVNKMFKKYPPSGM
jgi:hypothetical protein